MTLYNYNVYNVLIKSTGHTINGQINVWLGEVVTARNWKSLFYMGEQQAVVAFAPKLLSLNAVLCSSASKCYVAAAIDCDFLKWVVLAVSSCCLFAD